MSGTGTTTIDFGAFPGTSDAVRVITGQAGILSGSLAEAWIFPVDTADHTADEHMVEPFKVFAHSIVAGTGFTISAFNTNQINEPLELQGSERFKASGAQVAAGQRPSVGGMGTLIYGIWNIAWAWN
jgi:hypothetical protein